MVVRSVAAVAAAGRAADVLLTAADDALMAELRAHVAAERRRRGARRLAPARSRASRSPRCAASRRLPVRWRCRSPPSSPDARSSRRELVEYAHRHGVQVHVWTIDEPEEMRALLDLGVDGIVTDFPARLVRLLEARTRKARSDLAS